MSDTFNWFSPKCKFPNILNYLNTTFNFGKQTGDNFINRKVQYKPIYSFIHSFSCLLLGESRGQQNPRMIRNTSRSTAISDGSVAPHQDVTKQGRRCSHATCGPWTNSGPLSLRLGLPNPPGQCFTEILAEAGERPVFWKSVSEAGILKRNNLP